MKVVAIFQTLQTWIGHNATRYHNVNALPHVLPYALPYSLSEICQVLGYLQRVTTIFFKKNINIYFYVNLMVTCCNTLQIVPTLLN